MSERMVDRDKEGNVSERCNRVLILDQSPWGRRMQRSLLEAGVQLSLAGTVEEALEACRQASFDAVLMEFVVDGKATLDLIESMRRLQPDARIVVVSGRALVSNAAAALNAGAYDYIPKPAPPALVLHALGIGTSIRQSAEHLSLASMKRMLIEDVLLEAGSISAAARTLGIDRSSFRRMVTRYAETDADECKQEGR